MSWQCEACGQEIEGGQAHLCHVPYRGVIYKSPPQPRYDMLTVGKNGRHAYRNGIEVDERTGKPLRVAPVVDTIPVPPKRKPGRPRKILAAK